MSSAQEEREYVLGTGDDELRRLRLQHRLWSPTLQRLWDSAGFGPGMRFLDVGCGPGYMAFDLVDRFGRDCDVVGVDQSARFIDYFRSETQRLELGRVHPIVADVQTMGPADGVDAVSFDAAYTRWVLCFTPDPAAAVQRVADALKPGGRFLMQEYFNYRALTPAPMSERFDVMREAIRKSWLDAGGNDDIGGELPRLCRQAGLKVVSVEHIGAIARPGEALWQWPTSYFETFFPRLVESGYITETQRAEFMKEWDLRSRDPNAFFVVPPMVGVVAEKLA